MRLPLSPRRVRGPLVLAAMVGLWAVLGAAVSPAQRPAPPPVKAAPVAPGMAARQLAPGPESAAANRAILQAQLDAAQPFDRVVISKGTWHLDRPLWHDRDVVTLAGEPGATLVFPQSAGLIVGIPRQGKGVPALPAGTAFDATAAHDGSCGKRIGLRLRGGVTLASNGGPFQVAHGNWWKGETALTLDLMFEVPDVASPDVGWHMGASDMGRPEPIWCSWNHLGERSLRFHVGTVDAKGAPVPDLAFRYPVALAPGVHRLAFQVDVGACRAACWLDGKALANGDPEPPWKAARGLTLAVNHRTPWRVCGMGATANAAASDSQTLCGREQVDLYGLALSAGPKYGWDSGRRLDGNPANDYLSYFSDVSPVVATLPLQDDPALVVADRATAVRLGTQTGGIYGWGTALLLSREHAIVNANTVRQRVEGLTVRAAGDGLVLGYALYLTVADCDFAGGGGGAGIGSWNWGANYTTVVRDCWLAGPDAGLHLYYGMATLERLHVEASGRSAIWLQRSRVRMRGLFIGPYGTPECYLRLGGGSDLIADDTSIDVEDASSPSDAAVVVESSGQNASSLGARCVLRDFNLGDLNKKAAVVRLAAGDSAPKGLLDLSGVATSFTGLAPMRAIVAVDDPKKWTIRVDAPGLEGWPQVVGPDDGPAKGPGGP